ncbi:hypothetical protein N9842_02255 [Porticoccaceae bacterium]|jgi:hypothetical protein|nr:hypothetical protein [Porticoccaceae bacterium]MDB9953183.1 hypothetical protein [Porticoccaceae bacterium]
MSQVEKLRFIASSIVGPLAAVLIWAGIVSYGGPFSGMSILGLAPVIFAGVSGGIVSALIASSKKLQFTIAIGIIFGIGLLAVMFSGDRFPLLGRNPFFWYWPVWLIPSFAIGGVIGTLIHKSYN